MSWMDSWSRPSKSAAFPPPIYLTATGPIPYCHTCGRVISSRKNTNAAVQTTVVKYCSARCRHSKPGAVDRKIEDAFAALLNDDLMTFATKYPRDDEETTRDGDSTKVKKGKGDERTIVWCSEVEELVFGSRFDASKTAGRRKNRAPRGVKNQGPWKSVDMEDSEEDAAEDDYEHESDEDYIGPARAQAEIDFDHKYFGAGKIRPEQSQAEVNGSVGGEKGWAEKIEETPEMLQKRLEGQRRAEERELVRKAARRGVAFGFVVDKEKNGSGHESAGGKGNKVTKKGGKKGKRSTMSDGEEEAHEQESKEERKLCEAVITKAVIVVEPSFAKGDWGIRWREEV